MQIDSLHDEIYETGTDHMGWIEWADRRCHREEEIVKPKVDMDNVTGILLTATQTTFVTNTQVKEKD